MDRIVDILANSTNSWVLCDNAPLLSKDTNIKKDEQFDEWILEDTCHIVCQGLLDT